MCGKISAWVMLKPNVDITNAYFRQLGSSKEHWLCVSARVGWDLLLYFYSVIGQEIVEHQLTLITEHAGI